MSSLRRYAVFDLIIASELELPELFTSEDSEADVSVRYGRVLPLGPNATDEVEQWRDGITLDVPGTARFHVRSGREIIVHPLNGASDRNVRVFLLGSAFGILLHQRRLLPLHANAVEIEGKAFAFLGESGAGKSTLAAWFHDRGERVIADDVCVIRMQNGCRAMALPGLPRFRLWREALERSGRSASDQMLSFEGKPDYPKYDVAVKSVNSAQQPLELKAMFLLAKGKKFKVIQRNGLDAAEAVFANTYRGAYINAIGVSKQHFASCLTLIGEVPLFQVSRTWGLERFEAEAEELDDFARRLIEG